MHIPDSYLSPQTALPALAVMAPLWATAAAKLRRTLRLRQMPLLALGAAFTFVIMLFNVPIPFASTGHAVGAVLVAILLGPWAALLAVSLALAVQAFVFADGGVLALGANCLTMAVIMPFTGWGVYRLLAGAAPAGAARRQWAAGVAGYVGLNAAALGAAVLFGIQPWVAHDATGRALYFPYGLAVTVPVMVGEHALVFGWVEALVTGLALGYLQRTAPGILPNAMPETGAPPRARVSQRAIRSLAWGLGILVLLSPLGILLPRWLHAGGAWGEGATARWHGLLPNYALPGQEPRILTYLLAGVLGAGLILLLAWIARRWLARKEPDDCPPRVDASANQ